MNIKNYRHIILASILLVIILLTVNIFSYGDIYLLLIPFIIKD
ncbi:TPA: hypothetical protein ACXNW8_000197 [Clostridium botulinum]